MTKQSLFSRSTSALAAVAVLIGSTAQAALVTNWVAFNDHTPGPLTHANANTYNLRGIAGQPAEPTSGFLKEFPSGLLRTNFIASSATGSPDYFGTMNQPTAGTPAHNLFNGIVDVGNVNSGIGVRSSANSTATITFSNLNTTARYVFRGTSVRGGNYGRRWTKATLIGADSFVNAHTAGVYTRDNFPTGTLETNQAAWNSGHNLEGELVGWDEIAPGADGVIQLKCEQYTDNPLPNTQAPDLGAYGYAFNSIMLAELVEPAPAQITVNPPASVTVEENRLLSLSVTAIGAPAPTYQWYKDNEAIPGATARIFSISRAQVTNSGTYHVVVSNSGATVTSTSTAVTVTEDTTAPSVVATASADGLRVGIRFSEDIDPTTAAMNLSYSVNDGVSAVVGASVRGDGRSVLLTLDLPLTEPYTLQVYEVTDLAGNVVTPAIVSGSVSNFVTGDLGLAGVDPLAPGSTFTVNNQEFEIVAGGTDIWGNGDQGHAAFQSVTGNFDISVHLKGLTQADAVTKAGLMVRESTATGSRNLYINANPATGRNQVELGTRRATDGVTDGWGSTFVPAGIPNLWLRIERFGDTFYGYRSTNGQNWILMGSSTQDYPDTVLIGMAATAHNNSVPPTLATFDQLRNVSYPGGSITITSQPQSVSIPQNESVTFSVAATAANIPASEVRYQWLSNGVPIAGANGSNLFRRYVTQADDDGDIYSVVVSGPGVSVTSGNATLTVTTDNVRPTVRYVISPSANSILVYFSEPMNVPDYLWFSVSNAAGTVIEVNGAVADPNDPTAARLTTATALEAGMTYTLVMDGQGVVDTSFNAINPDPALAQFLAQNYAGDPATLRALPTEGVLTIGSLTNRGFNGKIVQVAAGIANDNTVAEQMLAGTYLNPGTGLPYPNVATVTNFVETNIINYKGNTADAEGRITNDLIYPGIPGTTGSRENIAIEVLTYLELQPGIYQFGVNSDDGFRVTPATSVNDPNNSVVLGEFNGGRGAADTTFDVVVTRAGLYPMRLIYEQGAGGANLEWWSVPTLSITDGVVAVNATNGIPAFRAVSASSSPTLAISTSGGNIVLSWPVSATGYHVETKVNLTDATWTPTGTIVEQNGQNTVTLPRTGTSGFFRLAK